MRSTDGCGKPIARQVMDMVVDHRVIIDNKVTDRLREADSLHLFGYLCATDIEVGLVRWSSSTCANSSFRTSGLLIFQITPSVK